MKQQVYCKSFLPLFFVYNSMHIRRKNGTFEKTVYIFCHHDLLHFFLFLIRHKLISEYDQIFLSQGVTKISMKVRQENLVFYWVNTTEMIHLPIFISYFLDNILILCGEVTFNTSGNRGFSCQMTCQVIVQMIKGLPAFHWIPRSNSSTVNRVYNMSRTLTCHGIFIRETCKRSFNPLCKRALPV